MNSKIFCGIIFSSHRLGTLGRKNTKKITPETVSRTPSALFFWRFKNDTVTKLLAIVGHVFLNFLGCGPSKKLEDPFSPRKKALNHKKVLSPAKLPQKYHFCQRSGCQKFMSNFQVIKVGHIKKQSQKKFWKSNHISDLQRSARISHPWG